MNQEDRAYREWRRAEYFYKDIVEIYKDQPGGWWTDGPIHKAQQAATEAREAYVRLRLERERREETR